MPEKPLVEVNIDFNVIKAQLTEIGRKALPLATAKTLTFLAKNVEAKTYKEMESQFDRVTPVVMRSLRTKTATVNDLSARVYVKGWPMLKQDWSMADILAHQFEGGDRKIKRSEKRFRQAGLLKNDEWLAPGVMARLDKYGNISNGQLQQIFSQIGLMVSGADNVATGSSKSVKSQRRAGYFFWSDGDLIDLARGVWQAKKGGRDLNPILMAVSKPSYKALINMDKIKDDEVNSNLNQIFERVFKKEVSRYE